MYDMTEKERKDAKMATLYEGHSEHEILELIRRIVGANPREEEK